MSKNYELELYKLIKENDLINEFGWCSDGSCCVWINYGDLDEFIKRATKIFGYGLFDDTSFDANMQCDGVCIDLCEMFCDYDIDFEEMFPKADYQH
jgi:hypothetical protein